MPPEGNRTFLLKRRPTGVPERDDFELVDRPIPTPGDGEVLLRTTYLSVDPVMRDRMREADSYADPWAVGDPLLARTTGEVVESRHAN